MALVMDAVKLEDQAAPLPALHAVRHQEDGERSRHPDAAVHPARSQWVMARVQGMFREREGMTCLVLRLPEGAECRPGEDYMIKVPSLNGFHAMRCACASLPGDPALSSTLELMTRASAGSAAAAVLNELLRPGDVLEVCGPVELFAGMLGTGQDA